MTRTDFEKLLNAAAQMIGGIKIEIVTHPPVWTTPGSSTYRDYEGDLHLGNRGSATFVKKVEGITQVTQYGLLGYLFDHKVVVVDEPTRRRATAKAILEEIGLTPEQIATIKAMKAKMVEDAIFASKAAVKPTPEQDHLGILRNESLIVGSSSFPKDTPLIKLIDADPKGGELLTSLREAASLKGADMYKVLRAVRNALAADVGIASMSDGANWRPDSVSSIAKAVGVETFVSTLVATLNRQAEKVAARGK